MKAFAILARSLTIMVLLLAAHGQTAAPDDVPVLTVCEVLSDLDRYEGKSIIIVGRSSWTDEGSWLTEDCGLRVVRGGREFSNPSISTAYAIKEFAPPPEMPKGSAWDKRLLQQKVAQLKRTTKLHKYRPGKYNEHWAAVFGRLEAHLPREWNLENGGHAYSNGFGHEAGSPAQLIASADGFVRIK
jgi:hypothetical protein